MLIDTPRSTRRRQKLAGKRSTSPNTTCVALSGPEQFGIRIEAEGAHPQRFWPAHIVRCQTRVDAGGSNLACAAEFILEGRLPAATRAVLKTERMLASTAGVRQAR
ncbi:MAG: hypothetical protein H6914_07470 [Novosphingobium sp.]|nr:hypothetical protein [Novosphingobium sp.]